MLYDLNTDQAEQKELFIFNQIFQKDLVCVCVYKQKKYTEWVQ